MIDSARILEIIKTKQEAVMFQKHLEEMFNEIYSNKTFEEVATEQLNFDIKQRFFNLVRYYRIDITNRAHIQAFIRELQGVIQQMPIVSLTLAFAPHQQMIESLSTWFIAHQKKPYLLDISVNRELLGGAVISYKGTYLDYSLKKILEEKYSKGELRLQS